VDGLDGPFPGTCEFVPDGLVYGDEWGGIDEVKWTALEWDGASVNETSSGCYEGSSCLSARIDQWSGFHLYLRQAFPATTFSTLSIWARADSSAQITFAPSYEGERCTEQAVEVGPEWHEITFDLATACSGFDLLTSVTVQNTSDRATILLDEIEYRE